MEALLTVPGNAHYVQYFYSGGTINKNMGIRLRLDLAGRFRMHGIHNYYEIHNVSPSGRRKYYANLGVYYVTCKEARKLVSALAGNL